MFFVIFVYENSFAQRFADRRRLLYLTFVKLQTVSVFLLFIAVA